jgi:hypothetical protein
MPGAHSQLGRAPPVRFHTNRGCAPYCARMIGCRPLGPRGGRVTSGLGLRAGKPRGWRLTAKVPSGGRDYAGQGQGRAVARASLLLLDRPSGAPPLSAPPQAIRRQGQLGADICGQAFKTCFWHPAAGPHREPGVRAASPRAPGHQDDDQVGPSSWRMARVGAAREGQGISWRVVTAGGRHVGPSQAHCAGCLEPLAQRHAPNGNVPLLDASGLWSASIVGQGLLRERRCAEQRGWPDGNGGAP